MKTIKLDFALLSLTEDDILIVSCIDNHIFELDEIKEIINQSGVLTNGRKVPTLTDPGEYSDATKEALDYMFSPAATEFSSYDAFIVKTLAHKILGNFYLKVKKPSIPTRLFQDKKTALIWLRKSRKLYTPS